MRIVSLLLACGLVLYSSAKGQVASEDVTGFWTGALVRDGTPLLLNVEIEDTADGLVSRTTVPEWLWYRGIERPVRLTEDGIAFELFFYDADIVFAFDSRYRQLVGMVGASDLRARVHLKRVPAPPTPPLREEAVSFASADGTEIGGTLVLPTAEEGPVAALILRPGRGCTTGQVNRARLFAAYGIATLAYDRRGAGGSGGDCATQTFDALVDDAAAAFEMLAAHEAIDAERIGIRGSSLGAWVAQGLIARGQAGGLSNRPAFLVTWIGPATSIEEQQIASAYAVAESEGLGREVGALAAEAVRIASNPAISDEEAFDALSAIRSQAEDEGWLGKLFAPDDLPQTLADMPSLFLRRFSWDPAAAFAEMEGTPVLAIFGEEDPVVPLADNLAAIEGLRTRDDGVRIVVIPGQSHSLEHGTVEVVLPNGKSYLKYDTVEPTFVIETLDFLRERGFATR